MSAPLFQARFEILDVQETNPGIEWLLTGQVFDNSNLAFTADSAEIGNIVFCENYFGDVDRFRITGIISKNYQDLVCTVVYDEPGTPRIGQPVVGSGVICAQTVLNKLGQAPLPANTQISDYLAGGIRNSNNVQIDEPLTRAIKVLYDNAASGLSAQNVQAALDEIKSLLITAGAQPKSQHYVVVDPEQKSYVLAHVPRDDSDIVALNGMLLTRGAAFDYQLEGQTVTFADDVELVTGDRLLFKYTF